jgi:release factor glutamine methyltransferase
MRYRNDIDIVECAEVYPPSEDTFLLLGALEVREGERVLEMGPGTGLITCHLAAAGAVVTAADVNPRAVACTEANLRRNGLSGAVVESDLFDRVPGRFDTIVFNPPYCAGEEDDLLARSWAGGADGVGVTARFLAGAPPHLLPGGRVVLLLSSEMEAAALERALSPFERTRLGERRLFFEALWVEELRPLSPA